MRPTLIERSIASVLLILIAWYCQGQSRATCLYSEAFSAAGIPADWVGLPATVERLDENGVGTGEFVAPWQVGNAVQANVAGYFPVPDEPAGNTFAMVNDDAPPCDCAMTGVSLFSPFYDLSAAAAPALSYRVYHDGRPFNTQARLWASPDGSAWTIVEVIPPILNAWQQRTVDLSAFAGGTVQLSFRYDDGGQWASGFAVDDVCVFDRPPHDVALTNAWLGDATASAFNTSARTLGYTRMPIEQQTPLRLSARIRNNGTATALNVSVEASISVDGGTPTIVNTTVLESLAPLQDTMVSWETGFTAGEPGQVEISLIATTADGDDETSDNAAQLEYTVTSAEDGNHTMALDNDLASAVCGTDSGFSAGCRYELISGGTVRGLSVRFGAGTQAGARVQAVLMDANLNLLSVSADHTVNEEDLSLSFSGGSVYIPLDSTYSVAEDMDVLALVRCLPDSGSMRIACGGVATPGSAFLIDGLPFTVNYPGTMPIVRMHFSDPVTSVPHVQADGNTLIIRADPAQGTFFIQGLPESTPGTLDVLDVSGRIIARSFWRKGERDVALSARPWAPGLYRVVARTTGMRPLTGAFVVE